MKRRDVLYAAVGLTVVWQIAAMWLNRPILPTPVAVMQVFVTYAGLASPITLFIQPLAPTTESDLTQPPIPAGFKCREP